MGCGSSSSTAIHPLTEPRSDADARKCECRGDSAVSKVTTDSGVGMENSDGSVLPEAVPDHVPPLTSKSIAGPAAPNICPEESQVQELPRSSEILEELLRQGIIPVGQSSKGAAYSIMLEENEGIIRRPPVRLESLRAQKAQSIHSREHYDKKMKQAEERRKMNLHLRTKSARVRGLPAPVSHVGGDRHLSLTPVISLQLPQIHQQCPTPQLPRKAADGGKRVTEAERDSGDGWRGGGHREADEENAEEQLEVTQVEELMADQLLSS